MFKGQFNHSIDDKNRLVLPNKFRDELGYGAVITFGFDGCLTIYTQDAFTKYQDELSSIPMTSADKRRHLRVLIGSASDVELDKSGRITLPFNLIADAGITKECVIIGVGSYIEVWSLERYSKEMEIGKSEFEEIAEKLTNYKKEAK